MKLINLILKDLHSFISTEKIKSSKMFFKEENIKDDIFIGVSVPNARNISKKYYKNIDLNEIAAILKSKIHEERLLALIMLVQKFKSTKDEGEKKKIFNFYIDEKNIKYINNWDLVDTSCYSIIGNFILKNPEYINTIYEFAKSENLWIRRVAIVSTLTFIKAGIFDHTTKISQILIKDDQDLIHKAVGWMLREVGKMNQDILLNFLKENNKNMPSVALRYAMEKLTTSQKLLLKN